MGPNHRAPYFSPPPGQSGAPPPLPPRRQKQYLPTANSYYPSPNGDEGGRFCGGHDNEPVMSQPLHRPSIIRKPLPPPRNSFPEAPPVPPRPELLRSGPPPPWQHDLSAAAIYPVTPQQELLNEHCPSPGPPPPASSQKHTSQSYSPPLPRQEYDNQDYSSFGPPPPPPLPSVEQTQYQLETMYSNQTAVEHTQHYSSLGPALSHSPPPRTEPSKDVQYSQNSFLEHQPWWQEQQQKETQEREDNIAAGYGHLYQSDPVSAPIPAPLADQLSSQSFSISQTSYDTYGGARSDARDGEPADGKSIGAEVPPALTYQAQSKPMSPYEHSTPYYEIPSYISKHPVPAESPGIESAHTHSTYSSTPHNDETSDVNRLTPGDITLDAIDQLISGIGSLNTSSGPGVTKDSPSPVEAPGIEAGAAGVYTFEAPNGGLFDDGEWARPLPITEVKEERNEVRWDCAGSREIKYDTDWYHMPDVPDFLICTRCHYRYIKDTKLSDYLEKTRRPTGTCRFHAPRLRGYLAHRFRENGDIEPIKAYMTNRLQILDCKGLEGYKDKSETKWFKLIEKQDGNMDHFTLCEACHEDIIVGSPYEQHFGPREEHVNPSKIRCDLSWDYARRCLKYYARRNLPLKEWLTTINKYYHLPKCEGKAMESSRIEWVRPRREVKNLVICETCYYDKIALTALEPGFEYIPIQKPVTGSEWMDVALGHRAEEPTSWVCDASIAPIKEALYVAEKLQDVDAFCDAATVYTVSPQCTNRGISNGTWYSFIGGCDEYGACSACYSCCVEIWGLGRFYEKAKITGSPTPYLCSFQENSPRFLQSMHKLAEAIEMGSWPVFENFIRKWINVAVCPRYEHVKNINWYGYDDCLVCAECYESFCKDNSPGPGLELQHNNVTIEDARMCCMYSPRMREKWVAACEKGDPKNLIEFSQMRHGIYANTIPQVKMLRGMQEMQMMQGMHAGYMSVLYNGIQGIQTVNGTTDGYLHGNSSVGWHETEAGATSAQFQNQMSANFSQANSSGSWMTIFRLTMQWQEVE